MFVMDKKAFVGLMKGNHEEREEMESAWALMSHEIVPHGPEHSAQFRIVLKRLNINYGLRFQFPSRCEY